MPTPFDNADDDRPYPVDGDDAMFNPDCNHTPKRRWQRTRLTDYDFSPPPDDDPPPDDERDMIPGTV
jgi:hypothetical protein